MTPPTEEVISPSTEELLIQPKKVCYEDSEILKDLINTTEEFNALMDKRKQEFDELNDEVSPNIDDVGKKTSGVNNNQWDCDEVPSAKRLMAMIYGLGQNCDRTNRSVETLSKSVDKLTARAKVVGDGLIEAKTGLQTVAKLVNFNSDVVATGNRVFTESLKTLGGKVEMIGKKQEEFEGQQQSEMTLLKDRLRVVEPVYAAPKKSGCEMDGFNPPALPQKQHSFLPALTPPQDNPVSNDALERNTTLGELPKADGKTPESVEEVPSQENDSAEAKKMDAKKFSPHGGVEDPSQNFSQTFAGGMNRKSNQTTANSNHTPDASDKKDSNDSPEGSQQQRDENTDESADKKEQSEQPGPGGPNTYPLPKCVHWINAQLLGNTGKSSNNSDTLASIVGKVTMRGIQDEEFKVKRLVADMMSDETEKIKNNKPYYLTVFPEQAIDDINRRGHMGFHNTESFKKTVEGRDIFQGQQRLILCPLKLKEEGSTEPVLQSQGTPLANSDSSKTVNDSTDKHTSGDNFRHSTVRTSKVQNEERRHEEKFQQDDRGSRNEQYEENRDRGYRQRQSLHIDTEGDSQGYQGGQDRGYQGYQHGQQGVQKGDSQGYQGGQDRGYQGYQHGQQGAHSEGGAQHGQYGSRYGDRNGQYDSRDQHYGDQGYHQTPRTSSFQNCFNNQGQSISGEITTPRHMTVTQKAEKLHCNPVDIAKLATQGYHGGTWGFKQITPEDIGSFGLMEFNQGVCERDIVNRHDTGMTNWYDRYGRHGPQEKSILDNDHIPFLEKNYSNTMLVEWWDKTCKILAQHEKIYLVPFDAINPDKGYEGLVIPGLGIERYTKMAEVLMETIFHFLPQTGEFDRLKTKVEQESKNGFDALFRVLQLTLPGFSELKTEDRPVWDEKNGTIDEYHKDWRMYSRIQSKDKKQFGHRTMALQFLEGIKAGEYDNMVSNLRTNIEIYTRDRVPPEVPDELKSAYLPTSLRISSLCDQLTKGGSRQAESGWKNSYRPSVKRANGENDVLFENDVPFEMEELELTLQEAVQDDPMVNFTTSRGRGSYQGRQGSGSYQGRQSSGSYQGRQGSGSNRRTGFKQRQEREGTGSFPSNVRGSQYSGNTGSTSTLTSTTGGRSAGNVPQATPRVGSNQKCPICGDTTHFYKKCPLLILGLYVERVLANRPIEYRNRFIQDVTKRLNKPATQPRVRMLRAMEVNEQIDWSGAIPQYVEERMTVLANKVDWEPQMMAMFKEVGDAIDDETN